MATRKVIIELKGSPALERNFAATFGDPSATLDNRIVPKLENLTWDEEFPVCSLPTNIQTGSDAEMNESNNFYDTSADFHFSMAPEDITYLARGTVDDANLEALDEEVKKNKNVVQVYADVQIESQIICPGSPPLETDSTVENLLNVPSLKKCGMNGKGVKVAIVDTGVNMRYLNSQGKNPVFDAANSWKPSSSAIVPGSAPVGHGTMCAFDVCIAAPDCTILDIALLTTQRSGSTIMEGFLSDAILAYRHLLNILFVQGRPGENKSLVVNNSWGMFHPSWDYPVGHPGNYSDNPNHPFNQIVHTLERAGADILFAAGNCGKDCPDGRCQGVTTKTIYGANSSPYVTCVAGVDTSKQRVGYSAIGPGRLTNKKPDIAGYTHFSGSGVYSADGGTSAACPVVAGVVAAIRTQRPLNTGDPATSPSAIRSLMFSAAEDLGPTGFDYLHGYGVVSTEKMIDKICKSNVPPICKRYPWICKWLCRHYPHLCRTNGLLAGIEPIQEADIDATLQKVLENAGADDQVILGFLAGLLLQKSDQAPKDDSSIIKNKDCGCKG